MKSILATGVIGILIGMWLSACTTSKDTSASGTEASVLSDNERHCLYAAALAATESPLESSTFKQVCQKIGVFDLNGKQNENYMGFVQKHVEWAMKAETAAFRQEINSREKARAYLNKYSP
jgi:hypothetical protein